MTEPGNQRFVGVADLLLGILDDDGRFVHVGGSFESELGCRRDDLVGHPFVSLIHDDDRSAASECLTSLGADTESVDFACRCLPARDGARAVHWRADRIATSGQVMIAGRFVSGVDRLRSLVDYSADLIAILDAEARLTFVNPSFARTLGYPGDDWLDQSIFDLIWPEDRSQAADLIARILASPDQTLTWRLRVRHADRAWRWLEGTGTNRIGDPALAGIVINCRDVTDRVESVAKVERSEELLRQVVRLTRIGVFEHDQVNETVYWSPRLLEIYGWDPAEELTLADIIGMIHPEDAPRIQKTIEQAHSPDGTGVWAVEYRIMRQDGVERRVTGRSQTLFEGEGETRRPVRTIGAIFDDTELKELQEQLLQAQKMESVGRLAGGVAHDFNNLLTVMKGYLELAVPRLGHDDPVRRDLGEVSRAVDSAARLTQQLLAFSRKQIIDPQTLNLNEVIRSVEKMLRRLLGEDIILHTVPGEDLHLVRFDLSQSEQILVNLAINARDAMPDGGTLTMETANVVLGAGHADDRIHGEPGEHVMLTVSDSGAGMGEETMAHLFEPFYTTKEPGQGTGLGLSMVYGAVSQNGGRIEVYSEIGYGTTFRIYLPRIAVDEADAIARVKAKPPHGTETVVLVEDDDSVRFLVTRMLRQLGYTVHVFSGGASALAAVGRMSEHVDLLITDVIMPEMNGRVLAEAMVKLRPDIRVLFTSGYTNDVIVNHGLLEDGVEFLPKPFTVASLGQRVRDVLDRTEESSP